MSSRSAAPPLNSGASVTSWQAKFYKRECFLEGDQETPLPAMRRRARGRRLPPDGGQPGAQRTRGVPALPGDGRGPPPARRAEAGHRRLHRRSRRSADAAGVHPAPYRRGDVRPAVPPGALHAGHRAADHPGPAPGEGSLGQPGRAVGLVRQDGPKAVREKLMAESTELETPMLDTPTLDAPTFDAPITAVTVFRDGAPVQRRGTGRIAPGQQGGVVGGVAGLAVPAVGRVPGRGARPSRL